MKTKSISTLVRWKKISLAERDWAITKIQAKLPLGNSSMEKWMEEENCTFRAATITSVSLSSIKNRADIPLSWGDPILVLNALPSWVWVSHISLRLSSNYATRWSSSFISTFLRSSIIIKHKQVCFIANWWDWLFSKDFKFEN